MSTTRESDRTFGDARGYPRPTSDVPFVSSEQMREVDRVMSEELTIGLVRMMENAGRNLADVARRRFLGGNPSGARIEVLAGPGGNGGGALVCARRLQAWGAGVRVRLIARPEALAPVTAEQLGIARRLGIEVVSPDAAPPSERSDLVIDGIFGYGLSGPPRGAAAAAIEWANGVNVPVLALDVPSGVDATTGAVYGPAIVATATMTLALPKVGLRTASAARHVGELYLADIGVPPGLYATLGLAVGPIFAAADVVALSVP